MRFTSGNPWAALVSLRSDSSPIRGINLQDFRLNRPPAIRDDGRCVFPGYYKTISESFEGLMSMSVGVISSSFVVEENSLKWKRSGPIPALRNVRFEILPVGGAEWVALNNVSFQSGAWQIPVSSIPGNGVVAHRGSGWADRASHTRRCIRISGMPRRVWPLTGSWETRLFPEISMRFRKPSPPALPILSGSRFGTSATEPRST